MPIVAAIFEIQIHGLNHTTEQVEELRQRIEASLRELFPNRRSDSDIEVDLTDIAGHDTP